jgi:Glycosyltransferase
VRPYMSLQFPFTADGCRWRIPENDTLKVVHAPTSQQAKGTKTFFRIFQELKDEGVKFDLQVLENRPHHEVLTVLSDADVLVDQLGCDCLGGLSFEGLASGCAVASGNCGSVPWPPDRPALSITPKTAKERIRRLLTDAPLRRSYAERGRDWVDYYQSPVAAAQAILDALDREKASCFDYYPVLFMQKAQYMPKAPTPEFLQQMTADILLRHGLHPDADIRRLASSKAISPATVQSLESAPLWDQNTMHKVGPWNWCGKHIPPPSFDPDMADWLDEDEASRLADSCWENTQGIQGNMRPVRDSIRYCLDWYYRRRLKRAYAKHADVKADTKLSRAHPNA